MNTCLVFGSTNTLDFQNIRMSVCRIPEVSLRIEEAQDIWDQHCISTFCFRQFLMAEDSVFFNNINLKSLVHAVVQLGLYDRYVRRNGIPQYIIGNSKNDSALSVASGQITLSGLIQASKACSLSRPMAHLQIATQDLLNGQSLPVYEIFVQKDGAFRAQGSSAIGLDQLISRLIATSEPLKFVHIGPGSNDQARRHVSDQVESYDWLESVDMDPMLNWFWSDVRRAEVNVV